ncbi:unnamed protein product [Leuciscus chuanchicus]
MSLLSMAETEEPDLSHVIMFQTGDRGYRTPLANTTFAWGNRQCFEGADPPRDQNFPYYLYSRLAAAEPEWSVMLNDEKRLEFQTFSVTVHLCLNKRVQRGLLSIYLFFSQAVSVWLIVLSQQRTGCAFNGYLPSRLTWSRHLVTFNPDLAPSLPTPSSLADIHPFTRLSVTH